MSDRKLKLMIMPNCSELGKLVDLELQRINGTQDSYMIDFKTSRFGNGEGKVQITDNISNVDLFIISDIGNYGMTYKFRGMDHCMSPDEHFTDIKRAVYATSGHTSKLNVIMPFLYQSRQHKRKGNESLDCAVSLQELERIGVNHIITFDAHDPSICNAIPRMPFENFYPTHRILEEVIDNEEIKDLLVVAPDMGAMERARYYADMLGCDVGVFYKRRDLTKLVNGKNPIIEHMYMGADPKGKDILIVDDMIASGGSIIEVAKSLKERGADKIFLVATFSLFTEGVKVFEDAYEQGLFDKLYTTNLTYVPKEILEYDWYYEVDCSKYLASIINTIHNGEDLHNLFNGKKEIVDKVERKKKNKNKK